VEKLPAVYILASRRNGTLYALVPACGTHRPRARTSPYRACDPGQWPAL